MKMLVGHHPTRRGVCGGLGLVVPVFSAAFSNEASEIDHSVITERDGQVIQNMTIRTVGQPGIIISHEGTAVLGCTVETKGAPGIILRPGANDVSIRDVRVSNHGAPHKGAEVNSSSLNVYANKVRGLRVDNVAVEKGSSGFYLVDCEDIVIRNVCGRDFRGPFPRGQFVQFDKCVAATLSNFMAVNYDDVSHPEDIISVYASKDCVIASGVVWGNNSPSGVGVMFEGAEGGLCQSVDAVYQLNGSFSAAGGTRGTIFADCRSFGNRDEDLGRGRPSSRSLVFAAIGNGTSRIGFRRCLYTQPAHIDNIIYDGRLCSSMDVKHRDFIPRQPTMWLNEPFERN